MSWTPGDIMTVKRMDNVGIVVEDIGAAIEFGSVRDRVGRVAAVWQVWR
jgi:hypothetical protein